MTCELIWIIVFVVALALVSANSRTRRHEEGVLFPRDDRWTR